ncbi:MAG: hypothetical protein ACE37D_12310 [Pseudomonadales bacterium]
MQSNIFARCAICTILLLAGAAQVLADNPDHESIPDNVALYYSDGSAPVHGIRAVNNALLKIGVRVSQVEIPAVAKPILKASKERAITEDEAQQLIRQFHLGRRELLNEIKAAGRTPEMHRGGYLQTSEVDVAPYPKVYDMHALDHDTTVFLQHKFGKLHVNSSEAGVGIDEVMTIVSGGPYTWFFVFENNVVGKVRFATVREDSLAWRISYPGLVPHGGYFDADYGLVVAYAHGPKHFVMRYEDNSVESYESLGDNPWIDFSKTEPPLLVTPRS